MTIVRYLALALFYAVCFFINWLFWLLNIIAIAWLFNII